MKQHQRTDHSGQVVYEIGIRYQVQRLSDDGKWKTVARFDLLQDACEYADLGHRITRNGFRVLDQMGIGHE